MTASPKRWLTFDVYGTLIDWRSSLRSYFLSAVGALLCETAVSVFLDIEVTARTIRPILPYPVLLSRALADTFTNIGVVLPNGADTEFQAVWTTLSLYEDIPSALNSVKDDGWGLGLITNCDPTLFGSAGDALAPFVDRTVSFRDVHSYKPEAAHLQAWADQADVRGQPWVHVASNYAHDIVPAFQMKTPTVWLDRQNEAHARRVATVMIKTADDLRAAVADAARATVVP